MATKTKKETKSKVETETVDVIEEKKVSTSSSSTRIVLDIPTASLDRFKMLCNLVGDTQSSMVTKAIDNYVDERKELVEQFIELRNKVSK